MAFTGRIVSIKLEQPSSDIKTMANALAAKNKTRVPGTGVTVTPKKETSNRYRTGIDERAIYIQKIQDKEEREEEVKRVLEMRERLQLDCGIDDLSSTSKYWNYTLYNALDQQHVVPHKLKDEENLFPFSNPFSELLYRWISVHPLVAPSYESFLRGDAGPDVMFYVHDDDVENQRQNRTKREINSAILKLETATPEKRKKVAMLMALPISDNSKEDKVYNLLDSLIKQTEFKEGKYKGLSPVRMFNRFMDMQGSMLNARVLVAQAIDFNIYRVKDDGIFEGEKKLADSEEKWISELIDVKSQQQLIALEEKLRTKKLSVA